MGGRGEARRPSLGAEGCKEVSMTARSSRSRRLFPLVGTSLAAALLAAPVLVHAGPTGYMRCYEARRTKDKSKLVPVSVSLQDQFNSASWTVAVQRKI